MRLKKASIFLLAILFVAAGIMHFVKPSLYLRIMPPWIPLAPLMVFISGVFEVLGGIGIAIPRVRKLSGFGLIALLLAVFPANIQMALNSQDFPFIPVALLWLRLPLQFVFIAWVWWCTHENADPEKPSGT